MADNKPVATSKDAVKELARSIYVQTVSLLGGRGSRQFAIGSFKAAEEFLQVQASFESGELVTKVEAQWGGDCFAPKLPSTHPLNLVSSQQNEESQGRNRQRVNRIAKWMVENPDPDKAYEETDWAWSVDTTRVARQLFPAYADPGVFPAAPKS